MTKTNAWLSSGLFVSGALDATFRLAYGVKESSILLSVSERHLRTAIKNGEIKTFRLGGRLLISIFELLRLMDEEVEVSAA